MKRTQYPEVDMSNRYGAIAKCLAVRPGRQEKVLIVLVEGRRRRRGWGRAWKSGGGKGIPRLSFIVLHGHAAREIEKTDDPRLLFRFRQEDAPGGKLPRDIESTFAPLGIGIVRGLISERRVALS